MPDALRPSGWHIEEEPHQVVRYGAHSVAKQTITKSCGFGIMGLLIMCDSYWSLKVNDMTIQVPNDSGSLFSQEEKQIVSTAMLVNILKKLNQTGLCTGNPDEKFKVARDRRKGKFMDMSG